MRRLQFLPKKTRDSLTRHKRLLNKLKHQEEPGILLFLSNMKNFAHVKKGNRKEIGVGVKSLKWFWRVQKFSNRLMILGSAEKRWWFDVFIFFSSRWQSQRRYIYWNVKALNNFCNMWETVCIFNKTILSHTIHISQKWMAKASLSYWDSATQTLTEWHITYVA